MTFALTALRISAGVIIWVLHFMAIYGITALACARGMTGLVVPAIAVSTIAAGALAITVIVAGWRRRESFEHWLSATIGGLALLAIVFEALPVLILPVCG